MSNKLRRCLSLVLVTMLLASSVIVGSLTASADTKTGDGLAAYAMNAYYEGWQYVWGGSSYGAVDCSGLIYSYGVGGARTSEAMLAAATETGYVSSGVPDIPGLGLWMSGHVGIYVGNGMAVDARGEQYGVCYSSVSSMNWVKWFKISGVTYGTDVTNDTQSENTDTSNDTDSGDDNVILEKGTQSAEVNKLQERLKELGFFEGNTTYYFGNYTQACLMQFQLAAKLDTTGIYDNETQDALFADNAPTNFAQDENDEEPETTDTDSEIFETDEPADTDSEELTSDNDEEISNGETSISQGEELTSSDEDTEIDGEKSATDDEDTDSNEQMTDSDALDNIVDESEIDGYEPLSGDETSDNDSDNQLSDEEASDTQAVSDDETSDTDNNQLEEDTEQLNTDTDTADVNADIQDNTDTDYTEGKFAHFAAYQSIITDNDSDTAADTDTNFDTESGTLAAVVDDAQESDIQSAENESAAVYLSQGDTGEDVTSIQDRLIELRYMTGEASGVYDEETEAAVELFLENSGYPASGSITQEQAALLYSGEAQNSPDYDTLQVGYCGEDVETLQQQLVQGNYLELTDVETVGVYDEATQKAVMQAQSALGLTIDGMATSELIKALSEQNNSLSSAQSSKAVLTASNTTSTALTNASAKVESPITGLERFMTRTVVLIVIGVSALVILFFVTLHYWNASMEKRHRKSHKTATVSVYRRRYM